MTRQDIISKTRAIMNEIGEEENLTLLSEDTVKLSEYIESVIPEAINIISGNENVPVMYLHTASSKGGGQMVEEDGCSVVPLPDDFLRFVSLRADGWRREVQELNPFGSDEYKRQHNEITRSGTNKPSCVMAHNEKGRCIECFPKGNIRYFNYVTRAANASDETLKGYDDSLLASICYACAYLVYNIFEMPNTAERMINIAFQIIPKR